MLGDGKEETVPALEFLTGHGEAKGQDEAEWQHHNGVLYPWQRTYCFLLGVTPHLAPSRWERGYSGKDS